MGNYGLSWPRVFSGGIFQFYPPDKYGQCELVRPLGYRLEGKWTASAVFTNHSVEKLVKYRGVLKEVVAVDDANNTWACPLS